MDVVQQDERGDIVKGLAIGYLRDVGVDAFAAHLDKSGVRLAEQ